MSSLVRAGFWQAGCRPIQKQPACQKAMSDKAAIIGRAERSDFAQRQQASDEVRLSKSDWMPPPAAPVARLQVCACPAWVTANTFAQPGHLHLAKQTTVCLTLFDLPPKSDFGFEAGPV